jgi:hypothetical protein
MGFLISSNSYTPMPNPSKERHFSMKAREHVSSVAKVATALRSSHRVTIVSQGGELLLNHTFDKPMAVISLQAYNRLQSFSKESHGELLHKPQIP